MVGCMFVMYLQQTYFQFQGNKDLVVAIVLTSVKETMTMV